MQRIIVLLYALILYLRGSKVRSTSTDQLYYITAGYAIRNVALKHFLVDDSNRIKLIDLSETCPLDRVINDPFIGIPGNVTLTR